MSELLLKCGIYNNFTCLLYLISRHVYSYTVVNLTHVVQLLIIICLIVNIKVGLLHITRDGSILYGLFCSN